MREWPIVRDANGPSFATRVLCLTPRPLFVVILVAGVDAELGQPREQSIAH